MSFKVESLFINVPIDTTVEATLQKLENDPQPCGLHDANTCSDCRPFELHIEIHILSVSHINLRTTVSCSHGKSGLGCYC